MGRLTLGRADEGRSLGIVDITDNEDAHRYEVRVDGKVAGYAEYHDRGDRRAFTHTVVEDEFEGQGIGSQLARFVLDDSREHDRAVLPYCTFIRGYIDRHRDDYLDLVPEDERAKFDLAA